MRPRNRDGFQIAIICALSREAAAVDASFDEYYDEDGRFYGKERNDFNAYTTGRIGDHHIVLAHMPAMGEINAARVAKSLQMSFRNISLTLLVGICGAVPLTAANEEIVLGDVIISNGVVEYDFGRQYDDKFERKSGLKDTLGRPNEEIRSLLSMFEIDRRRKQLEEKLLLNLNSIQSQLGVRAQYPGTKHDQLFDTSYRHKHRERDPSHQCACFSTDLQDVCEQALEEECTAIGCDGPIQRHRLARDPQPLVHIGTIASANTVMKSGLHRDEIAKQENIIAFEMEGAGIWDSMPCIVIKGVCDYADSHKNKLYQDYAAATAASGAKAFLNYWISTSDGVKKTESNSPYGPVGPYKLRAFQMRYLHSKPYTILDEEYSDYHNPTASSESWTKGIYELSYPSTDPVATIHLSIDWHALEGNPWKPTFEWLIHTPQSLYHPGTHRGRIIFTKTTDMFQRRCIRIQWRSPIFSPFITEYGQMSSDGPLEEMCIITSNLTNLLWSMAHFLAYGPYSEPGHPVPPFKFHDGMGESAGTSKFFRSVDSEKFARASSFFARAYTLSVPGEEELPGQQISPDCIETTSLVIRELLEWYDRDKLDPPIEDDWNFEKELQKVHSQREWALEEQRWADKLVEVCGLSFMKRALKGDQAFEGISP